MGNTQTKQIVLTQFTQGSEGKKTGSWFIALLSRGQDGGQFQWSLTPEGWGYRGLFCEEDEVVAGRILDAIATKNSLEGDDRNQKALDILLAAGENGIALELTRYQWEKLKTVDVEEKINRETIPSLLER